MAVFSTLDETSIVHYDQSEPQLARPGILLTVFPDCHNDSTNIIIACLKSDKNGVMYLNKFDKMGYESMCLAVSSLMLTTNRNNTFFHPIYWKAIQNHQKLENFNNELSKNRGFDLLAKNIKLSEFNLFDEKLTSKKLNILS
ncbi:MAG: hypothetical protein RLZ33_2405 [Bacteroidota bacterium]|jgi:hypothetical protein